MNETVNWVQFSNTFCWERLGTVAGYWGDLETVEHTTLQSMSSPRLSKVLMDIDRAQVLFPNVGVMTIWDEDEVSLEMCRKLLDIFPLLERVDAMQCIIWKATVLTTSTAAAGMSSFEAEAEGEENGMEYIFYRLWCFAAAIIPG